MPFTHNLPPVDGLFRPPKKARGCRFRQPRALVPELPGRLEVEVQAEPGRCVGRQSKWATQTARRRTTHRPPRMDFLPVDEE